MKVPWSPLTRPLAALVSILALLLPMESSATGSWSPVTNLAPYAVMQVILLSDGTVACCVDNTSQYLGQAWYRLTPDAFGSYANGTWSEMAPMHDSRLYCASDLLPDGRLFVAGGEYGTGDASAEIYDPLLNSWTMISPPTSLLDPAQNESFEDAISEVLADGNVLVAPVYPNKNGGTLIYNATKNHWQQGAPVKYAAYQAEASWVKLPDQSILTIDPYGTQSERYLPTKNTWVSAGIVPTELYAADGELGAGLLLADGRALFFGATGHNAYYQPATGSAEGTWTAASDFPNGLGTPDAPAAMMNNGKILCDAGPAGTFDGPVSFFEFDPVANAFTSISQPSGFDSSTVPYETRMLDLPDGSILLSNATRQLYLYKPDGTPLSAGQPTIIKVKMNADTSYHLTGTLLNGISAGAAYGDDAQMDSNYPILRLVSGDGHVYYLRTYDWSSTGVMTGSQVISTDFSLPQGLPEGDYTLYAVANGNPSAGAPFHFSLVKNGTALYASGDQVPNETSGTVYSSFSAEANVFAGLVKTGHHSALALFNSSGNTILKTGTDFQGVTGFPIAALSQPSGNDAIVTLATGSNGINAGNNSVLVTSLDSSLVIAAQTGLADASLPTGTTYASFDEIDGNGTASFFLATLRGKGVNEHNRTALSAGIPFQNINLLARTGDSFSGHTLAKITTLTAAPGSPAQNRWRMDGTTIAALLTLDNGSQTLVSTPSDAASSTDWSVLAQTGAVFSGDLSGCQINALGLPDASGSQVAALATLARGIGGINKANDQAIVRIVSGTITRLAQTGDDAPDADGNTSGGAGPVFASFLDPLITPAGHVTFQATLSGTGVTHSSNQGIWYAADGATPKLIARTGASAPGGGTWVSFKSLVLPDSSNGGPLFTGMLALGKGGVTIGNNVGLWGVDSTGDAQLILRTGQIVAVEGSYRIIQTFKALGSYPHSLGTAHGYDDAGNLYVTAIFTDGSQAMLKITPP